MIVKLREFLREGSFAAVLVRELLGVSDVVTAGDGVERGHIAIRTHRRYYQRN